MGFWDDNANLYEQGGVAGAAGGTYGAPGAGLERAAGPMMNATMPASGGDPVAAMLAQNPGMDPRIAQIYTQQGITPGGRGSGASDWQYWQSDALRNAGGDLGYISGRIQQAANGGGGSGGGGGGGGGGDQSPGQYFGSMPSLPGSGAQTGGWDGKMFTAAPIAGPNAYTPQAVGNQPGVTAQQVQGPSALNAAMLANPEKFQGVSAADLAADPGVQFRQQQGMGTLANKYAASGLRGAGQAQGFADYNQNLASQEYGNAYNRKFGEFNNAFAQQSQATGQNNAAAAQAYGLTNQYQQGAQIANQGANLQAGMFNSGQNQQNSQFNAGRTDAANQNNFANAFAVNQANTANAQNAWQGNTNAQLQQGSLNLGYTQAANTYNLGQGNLGLGYLQANQGYDLGLRNNALGYQNSANSYGLGQGQNQLGWANYGLNQQGQDFNQGFSLANMGLTAAGAYGNYAGQYGANAGGYATGAGNAGAAAANAGGQAWGQAFNGAAAGAAGAAGLYYGNRPPAGGQLAVNQNGQPYSGGASGYGGYG